MWWRLPIYLIFAALLLTACVTQPSEGSGALGALTLNQALAKVAGAVGKAPVGQDPVSVVSFRNINLANAAQTRVFGEYFADSLLATLKSDFPAFRIVERTELDKILQERQYSSEGLLTDENLKNLGPVLPARFVMTGQFTVFPHTVQVNARLLDVRTGEVVVSKIETIQIDDNVASLLGTEQTPALASKPAYSYQTTPAPPVRRERPSPAVVPVSTSNPGMNYSLAFGGGLSWMYFDKTQNYTQSNGGVDNMDVIGSLTGWEGFVDLSPYLTLRYSNRNAWNKVTIKDNYSTQASSSNDYSWNLTVADLGLEFKVPVDLGDSTILAPKIGLDVLKYSSGGITGIATTAFWQDLFAPVYLTFGADMNFFMGRNFFLRVPLEFGLALNSDLAASDYSYYGLTSNSASDLMLRLGADLGLAF